MPVNQYDPYAKNPNFTIDQLLIDLHMAVELDILRGENSINRAILELNRLCTQQNRLKVAYPTHELLDYEVAQSPPHTNTRDEIAKFFAIMQYASRNQKWPSLTIVTQRGNKIKFIFNVEKSRINISNGLAISNPDNNYYGSIYPSAINFKQGTEYAARERIKQIIIDYVANPEKIARIQGQHTGRCCFCAKELTNPHSIAYGYGPTCAGNYQLPYSTASKDKLQQELLK